MRTGLYVQFLHRHVWDTVNIVEEGNLPQLRCLCCDMLVPWAALNSLHPNTSQCAKGVDRKLHSLEVGYLRESTKWPSGRMAAHLPQFCHLSILDVSPLPQKMTGPRWWATYGRCRRSGHGFLVSWEGGQHPRIRPKENNHLYQILK